MSLMVSDLQLSLAYRLGETSIPNDSTTKAVRLEWINQGYMNLARRKNWHWLEKTDTSNTNTGSTTGYPEPSDLKEFKELKINNIFYNKIPYAENRIYLNTIGVVTLPTLRRAYKYYRYGGRYYLIPTDGNDGATHNIKYFCRVTKRTSDSDTFLLPDEYLDGLVAYAEGRYWMSISQQAKAVAPYQEYEEIYTELLNEEGRRGWNDSGFSILDPEQGF